jgi:hypothetical protein
VDAAARQQPTAALPPEARPALDISPGGAFLRAVAIPGWGHVAIGAYGRGGFYFGVQSTVVYTALRTRTRIGEAQARLRLREHVVRTRLAAEGVTDPETIDTALQEDAGASELRSLLDSRKEQQEDILAFGIFMLLLSGADAYVSAHLARFPDPLELEATPTAAGGMDLGIRVRLPN